MKISNEMYETLLKKYETEIQECRTTLLIYFENSVGIGDHPNHLDEMDELISKAASANDKIHMLKNMFEGIYSNPKL